MTLFPTGWDLISITSVCSFFCYTLITYVILLEKQQKKGQRQKKNHLCVMAAYAAT